MKLETIKLVPGILEFNFEELKNQLNEKLDNYRDLVVTEENEKEMSKEKANLNKLITAIEDYRKNQKKEMSKPITEFESRCKELSNLVLEVTNPLKEQLDNFENIRRKEKENKIKELIDNTIEKFELNKKYASLLNIKDTYLNKTQKENKTIEDLELRATLLKQSQENEIALEKVRNEKMDLIQKEIEKNNQKYAVSLKLSNFNFLLDEELCNITTLIETQAIEELKKIDFSKHIHKSNEEQKIIPKEDKKVEISSYDFSLEITECSLEKATELKKFLDENNFNYKLIKKLEDKDDK